MDENYLNPKAQSHKMADLSTRICIGALSLIVLLLATVNVPVGAAPPLPYTLYGWLTIVGTPAPDETQIIIRVNGIPVTSTLTSSDMYAVNIPGDDPDTAPVEGAVSGQTLSFSVSGYTVAQTAVWQEGQVQELDLNANWPTAATLGHFAARTTAGAVRIEWETGQELSLLGFHVYRSESPAGVPIRLNGDLIASQNPGSVVGSAYTWLDTTGMAGQTYYYYLEWVDSQVTTIWYGPVEATAPYVIYMPVVSDSRSL